MKRDAGMVRQDTWGCLILDRASRLVVAQQAGPLAAPLLTGAITQAVGRMGGRACQWCSDGWHAYGELLRQVYRYKHSTGQAGRPAWVLPDDLALTQVIKQHDEHGRVIGVELHASIGPLVADATCAHVERLHGCLRDHLACLTRQTHAFAKTLRTWQAAVGLAVFVHNWLREHVSLREPTEELPGRRYRQRTPAMAAGLSEHCWSWHEFLTTPRPVSR